MRDRTKNLLALSIIPQVLLVKLAAQFPSFIEVYYSKGLYPIISKAMRWVFGWIPFSIGDILYSFLIIYAIRWLIINAKRITKEPLSYLRDIFIALALVYFTFHVFWGMNYYREPLHKTLNVGAEYETDELLDVIDILTLKANDIHLEIAKNDSAFVKTTYTKKDMLQLSSKGFKAIQKEFPAFDPSPISIKKSLFRWPLTYMGFGGYFNPITNEAQVNTVALAHKMPTTSSHEKAHQVGYAAENEANFIAFLTTINHEDIYFRFSGYIFGLKYCLRELARRDPDLFKDKIAKVNIGIRKHYQAEIDFWQAYENPLEPIFKFTYNKFLKANNQQKGIESYSYVVALLVNYLK